MKIAHFVRLGAALCVMTVPAAVAGAEAISDPAAIISAFNETCRRGFPDLETIRRQARSQGWVQRSARLIAEGSDPKLRSADVPDFFQKGGMTMMLAAPNRVWSKSSCIISVTAEKTLDTRTLADAVSVALDGAAPSVAKVRGGEQAIWQVRSGLVVKASVSRSGRIRTANLSVVTG
jgi:hypothetical protein